MANKIDETILEKYEPTIGLEIHVQLDTKSKMFCGCNNDSENSEPNTNVCEICMGYPGTLPVANAQAMEFGAKLAAALGCKINEFQRFDRKNYFYPDLPKGYQISQFFYPVGEHGKLKVARRGSGETFEVGITRLHLEEDAGKLSHVGGASLVDLNRCGTPLAEIVTGPDIHSPEDAKEFMQELQRIVRALGVSKADMEKGHLRVDGNISVRLKGATELGGKVEVKNMNSFKFLEQALTFEIGRQIELLEAGEKVVQETRGWDEKTNTTISQRIKEGSVDYRYFPDPDLPPTVLSPESASAYEAVVETLPSHLRETATKFGLPWDRVIEMQDKELLAAFVRLSWDSMDSSLAVKLANFLAKGKSFEGADEARDFFAVVEREGLSATASLQLYDMSLARGLAVAEALTAVKEMGGSGVSEIAKQVIDEHPEEVARFRAGEAKLFGVFMGQVMARGNGAVDPVTAKRVLEELLAGE